MKLFIVLLLISIELDNNLFAQPQSLNSQLEIHNVSLVQLIATPEKYDNKIVQVVGYLNLEFESHLIFLHKEDREKHLVKNAFWVDFSEQIRKDKKLNDYRKRYVLIAGLFKMNQPNQADLYSGYITNITRLENWL